MERFSTARAWTATAGGAPGGTPSDAPGDAPRKSWRVDDTTAAPAAASWRNPRYDIAGATSAAALEAHADAAMATVDDRNTWDPNTHPEYAKWMEWEARAWEDNAAEEARMNAALDVTYDLDTRAFGAPAAPPPGTQLVWHTEAASGHGGRVVPEGAKAFWYAVDSATGAPTSGDADGWAPHGKAAELDAFVARTTWGGGSGGGGGGGSGAVAAAMVDPRTWEHRDAVVPYDVRHDPLDADLARGSADLARAFMAPPSVASSASASASAFGAAKVHVPGSSMRMATASTVRVPRRAPVQTVRDMNEASKAAAAEYAAQTAAATAHTAALRDAAAQSLPPDLRAAQRQRASEPPPPVYTARQHARSDGMPAGGGSVLSMAAAPAAAAAATAAAASTLALRAVPLRAVGPLVASSVRGALHDARHWRDLPCDGALAKLRFITTRDARAEYLLLALFAFALLLALVVSVVVSCRRHAMRGAAAAAGVPGLSAYMYRGY